MTVRQAAIELGLSPNTLYAMKAVARAKYDYLMSTGDGYTGGQKLYSGMLKFADEFSTVEDEYYSIIVKQPAEYGKKLVECGLLKHYQQVYSDMSLCNNQPSDTDMPYKDLNFGRFKSLKEKVKCLRKILRY